MDFNINGEIIFNGQVFDLIKLKKMELGVLRKINEIDCEKTVAIAMKRSPIMLVTIFVLLKKGIPFLPISLTFPEERLDYMLNKAKIETVISDCEQCICGRKTLFISETDQVDATLDIMNSEIEDNFADGKVAYILFTSGTTGFPKAVEVLRSGLKNFIEGIMQTVCFSRECKMLCLTNVTFDIFFLESVLALNEGMTVVLADENERTNPRMIKELIEKQSVNAIQCTPSTMRLLEMIDTKFELLKNVETLMIGGEPFPSTLLDSLKQNYSGRIYNMYGPTETTIWSTVSELTTANQINIGKPIKNTEIFIVDEELKQVPRGVVGEILIAGDGLAKGYLNDKERTEKAFVTLPDSLDNKRVYRTGDFGYLDGDSNYVCIGRRDDQVKVLGHRIELGDVEHHIGRIEHVENSVVTTDPNDGNRLICFYVSEKKLEDEELRNAALKLLPEYMVPYFWIHVDEMLYTDSGKTDRNAMMQKYRCSLENSIRSEGCSDERENNMSDTLSKVISCFCIVEEKINAKTVLESLGLDSLKYVACLVQIEEMFDIEFEDEMLSSSYFATMGDLVEYVDKVK